VILKTKSIFRSGAKRRHSDDPELREGRKNLKPGWLGILRLPWDAAQYDGCLP
jgi:hypothetical protein